MIVCGWCNTPTEPARCEHCGRDPKLPWSQRAVDPPVVDARETARRRLAEAAAVLGRDATVDQLADHFDVAPRTVQRWREMAR